MKANIDEIIRVLEDVDFGLIANKNRYSNPEGRFLLNNIKSKPKEVKFYIGSAGFIVIETSLNI